MTDIMLLRMAPTIIPWTPLTISFDVSNVPTRGAAAWTQSLSTATTCGDAPRRRVLGRHRPALDLDVAVAGVHERRLPCLGGVASNRIAEDDLAPVLHARLVHKPARLQDLGGAERDRLPRPPPHGQPRHPRMVVAEVDDERVRRRLRRPLGAERLVRAQGAGWSAPRAPPPGPGNVRTGAHPAPPSKPGRAQPGCSRVPS